MKKQRESQCTQKTISLLSPLGTIQLSGCENGVHTIQILMDVAPAERSSEAPLSCVVNDSPAETSPELQRCVEWLQAYFSEPQTTGSLPLPAFHHPALQGDAFTSRVLHVLLKDVKFGETVSYKRLAEMAGNPRAVRAVGGAMRRNPVFTVDAHCKSLILVGNLARIILPMNPLCTKWRARGQVVCLLLIKPFDQSPFSSAHVVLWAPPVCSVRQRTLLVQKCSQ
ncbi:methylated-DNA--protein-cysteine methyltransferase isoform X2 [Xiphias gladius]|nr:methylated-DNA--protein-cysteine methyltransferase isoform X2 [Xiphias gladius]XP_039995331.1 methylated-DNA--protein-cysteine methyltransferase isoform X2 [Xiphias gladius]